QFLRRRGASAVATRGVREVGRAESHDEASGYGYTGERERATLRAARALATWQFELSGSAARRGLSVSADANCPSAPASSRCPRGRGRMASMRREPSERDTAMSMRRRAIIKAL